jgi:EAL domain-containing protein (putative c-di-GMP-specific phosphodiesterase class I)
VTYPPSLPSFLALPAPPPVARLLSPSEFRLQASEIMAENRDRSAVIVIKAPHTERHARRCDIPGLMAARCAAHLGHRAFMTRLDPERLVTFLPAVPPDLRTIFLPELIRLCDAALAPDSDTTPGTCVTVQAAFHDPGRPADIDTLLAGTKPKLKRPEPAAPHQAPSPETSELEPFFQPVINMETHEVTAFELLARWRDADGTVHPPATFPDVLTNSAQATDLTFRMVRSAIDMQRALQSSGTPPVQMAINLTRFDLLDPGFVDDVDWRIKAAHLNWADFIFEVTEDTVLGAEDDAAKSALSRVRSYGGQIALDDFGTGHASLVHLRDWPIDCLKIDKRFVIGMKDSQRDAAIVSGLVALAHKLDLKVVAEGIEDDHAMHALHSLHCDEGQGFLIAKPMNAGKAMAFLADRQGLNGLHRRA